MEDLLEFNVNLYEKPPLDQERLLRQIEMATERLKLYKVFQSHENLTVEELKTKLDSPLILLLEANPQKEIMAVRKMDIIGHWTLRVAYSSNNHSFFIKNELRWFKMRFNNMSQIERKEFVKRNKINLVEATHGEKLKFHLKETWYKVYFTQVKSLVIQRMYPLSGGYIFIPEHKIVFLLLHRLEKHLTTALIHAKKMLVSSCDQLKFVLLTLDLVKPYQYSNKFLKLEDLESQVKHFPLCMKIQHETLKKNHHLKHFSRFQYGLFLKGIGLSLDDALEMWQNEFTEKMTKSRFVKDYSYFIKHLYGTVGSKIDYSPQDCDRIFESQPLFGAVDGCPYKHWDEHFLKEKLVENGISTSDIQTILVLKKEERYNEACTRCFQCFHNFKPKIITHPVMFYEQSCSAGIVDIEDLFGSESE